MTGGFSAAELALLSASASAELLAGLAHRFDSPEEVGLSPAGVPFVGHALACTVIDAALVELEPLARELASAATFRRRRERALSGDPLAGELDPGRLASAMPELGQWPITRIARSHDTPENAVIVAALKATSGWCRSSATAYADWIGVELFARNARRAGRIRRLLLQAFGDLRLESIGSAQLLPLALERLALRQAPPSRYRRALELVQLLVALVDPRRLVSRALDREWTLTATLGAINEAGLQHTAFELWVASQLIDHCRSLGYEVEHPHRRGTPLAVCRGADSRLEVWWQTPKPIVGWPSGRDQEIQRADGSWRAISLIPDLVVVRESGSERSILAIECKNKAPEAANSKDLAQAFGYLAHYGALPRCALVYRGGVESGARYRRASTDQGLIALEAPVSSECAAGEMLFEMLAAGSEPLAG